MLKIIDFLPFKECKISHVTTNAFNKKQNICKHVMSINIFRKKINNLLITLATIKEVNSVQTLQRIIN